MNNLTVRDINNFIVLLFKNGNDHTTRNTFDYYDIHLFKIKNLKTIIDDKLFSDQLVKTNKKCMKNVLKCQETITIQHETN